MVYAPLRLKKQEELRLQNGHLWIYSNEVDVAKTPLKSFQPGQMVQVERSDGQPLGLAYVNPHTLLCARLLTHNSQQSFDQAEIEKRIHRALARRTGLFPQPFYRLVYGESDALPGLIVDRYGDLLVVQLTTAGMECLQTQIVDALRNVVQPTSILWRNDHSMRTVEGLPKYVSAAWGDPPLQVELQENGVRFYISPWDGQKTGWFYDHRESRAQLPRYVVGKRLLDLFSYVGGWSVQAAVAGAVEVCAVDSSAKALELLTKNAVINHVATTVRTIAGDVFEQLKSLVHNKERFDVVIVDPPAFIKKYKDFKEGYIAYQRINEAALRLLNNQGLLITASCSQHLSKEQLMQVILKSSLKTKRYVQIIGQGHQAADHPLHPAIPETEYLKTFFCRVDEAF